MDDIASLRKSYEKAELDEIGLGRRPTAAVSALVRARPCQSQVPEPNAMTLATVGEGGRPSTRIVLIKGFDARGFVWYTNYEQPQGPRTGAAHPVAALQFHWVELERVVRIEGRVEKTSDGRVRRLLRTPARSTRAWVPGPRRRAR